MLLDEYIATLPDNPEEDEEQAEREREQARRQAEQEQKQAEREQEEKQTLFLQAEELKQSILEQIERGAEPESILYSAVDCIACYAGDRAFREQARSSLDEIYADTLQTSMLQNETVKAAARLHERQADYYGKLKRYLIRQEEKHIKIQKELGKVLESIEEMEMIQDD